ncbi:MAG: winged helix-turn-helix domain-containing protein [Nitrososphaerota archaeon]
MAVKRKRIMQAVYEALSSSGEALHTSKIFDMVKGMAPDLCDDSVVPCPYDGQNHPKWKHDAHWALQDLKMRGLVERVGRGLWRIAKPIQPQPQPFLERRVIETGEHERLKMLIKDIGEILGKYVELEYRDRPYVYDVVWKEIDALPPSHVFEIQDRGNVDAALAKLQHARDIWKCKLFLVVTGERDRTKVKQLLEPYWRGAFHRLARYISVLNPQEVEEIHNVFTFYREVIKSFLEE